MEKKLKVKVERDFGDIIGDGMKMVFRNFKPIFTAVLWYALPFVAISMIILVMSGTYKMLVMPDLADVSDGFAFISSFAIVGIGLAIGFVMINLIVYSAIMQYHETDGEVTYEGIKVLIIRYWKNYLASVIAEVVIIGVIVGIMVSSILVSPAIFSLVYFLGIIALIYLWNIIQFLGLIRIEEGLPLADGITRCFLLLKNNWWSTFGVILVSSFIGSILMYAFILPITVAVSIITALQMESGTTDESFWIAILSGAFVIFYAIIGILSNMYLAGVRSLKYYDLIEKKEGRNLMNEINAIGANGRTTIFENEGEF